MANVFLSSVLFRQYGQYLMDLQYLLFLPTIAGLLRGRQSVTVVNMNHSGVVHIATAWADFHISTRLLVVSAGLNRFAHAGILLSLRVDGL